jgi:hypothetical protein
VKNNTTVADSVATVSTTAITLGTTASADKIVWHCFSP